MVAITFFVNPIGKRFHVGQRWISLTQRKI
jgi:hypothetical protein